MILFKITFKLGMKPSMHAIVLKMNKELYLNGQREWFILPGQEIANLGSLKKSCLLG